MYIRSHCLSALESGTTLLSGRTTRQFCRRDAAKGFRRLIGAGQRACRRFLGLAACLFLSGLPSAIPAVAQDVPFRVLAVSPVDPANPGAVSMMIEVPTWTSSGLPDFELAVGSRTFSSGGVKRANDVPLAVVICIDKSGSMGRAVVENVKQSLATFLRASHPGVQMSLVAFGTSTQTLAAFDASPKQQVASLQPIQIEGREGKTKLYDAINGSITTLRYRTHTGPRRVIVISDGKDEESAIAADPVLRNARDSGITIDTISIGPLASQSKGALEALSAGTQGGHVDISARGRVDEAVEDALKRARTRTFQVPFQYKVDASGRKHDSVSVALSQAGITSVPRVVQGSFVAAEVPALPPKPEPSPPPSQPKSEPPTPASQPQITFDNKLVVGLSLGGLGLLLLLGYMLRKRIRDGGVIIDGKRGSVAAKPKPPPIGRSTNIVRYTFSPPQPGRPSAVLKARAAPTGAALVPIDKPLFLIGAAEESDLRLTTDDFVSNEHATIRYDSGSLYLADRGSRNGTYLNDARLGNTPMPLSIGDQLRFGRSEMIVQASPWEPAYGQQSVESGTREGCGDAESLPSSNRLT